MSTELPAPKIGAPHMFGREPELFERVIRSGVRRYLEWGMGGSTLVAVRANLETIVSVDSDRNWVEAVRRHEEIAPRIASGSMSVIHGDIGPTREWGNPADRSQVHRWPEYLAAPWAEWDRRGALPDLIFVDGRFRVSCCYSVALGFAGCGVEQAPLVMMHDVADERPSYQDAFEFLDIVEKTGSLVLARVRADSSRTRMFAKLMRRQHDYG